MGRCWRVVLFPEVAEWVASLTPQDTKIVQRMIAMLEERGNALRMPHSRPLGAGLFELRFDLRRGTVAQRVTYFFDGNVVAITTFQKTRQVETDQIARARRAMEEYWREKRT